MTEKGEMRPLVVAGPSGVGKGTLLTKLKEAFPDAFGYSISCTSRAPRPGEVNGVDYYFVSKEKFLQDIAEKKFLEYASNYDNFYGTLLSEVDRNRSIGKICLLEIDVQGVQQVQELEKRLRGRGTESEEKVKHRLEVATQEMEKFKELGFDKVIRNDDLDRSFQELKTQVLVWYPFLETASTAAASANKAE